MSKADIQRTRNENYRFVDTSKSLAGESRHPMMRYNYKIPEHEYKKLKVCMELTALGHKLLTECHFKSGGIADIFDLDTGTAYEIVNSESDKSIELKKNKYPVMVIKIEV